MIFAAGLGTRLGRITETCPKALVEVGGMPMLGSVLRKVAEAGATAAVVNVHHHADMVKEYLQKFSAGIPVEVSDETDLLLDTGGGVAKAAPMLRRMLDADRAVLLHNADILTDFPIRPMLEAHIASGADATLLTSSVRESSRQLLFSAEGRLEGWRNCRTGEVKGREAPRAMAFGGVHIIGTRVLDALEAYSAAHGKVFSITPFYVDNHDSLDIRAYEPEDDYRWIDIGRPESLARARELFGPPES